ncbi:MAG: ATP-binding protein [Chloroflexota bacterium]|nr:ATP-binding protein [Chloroflexota bacterium]
MTLKTINRRDSINLFHHLMQPDSEFHILRLLGEAKMGKTHLLTKVFPTLARQNYQAHYAVLDLRGQAQTPTSILHTAYSQIGDPTTFPNYCAAYQELINRSKVQVTGLQAILALVQIRAIDETDESESVIRHLTSQFVADLHNLADSSLLLLFDAVEGADERTRNWLMDILLMQLSTLAHVKIVVAGRSVPEAYGSYTATCHSYELRPVNEVQAYIVYCREIGANLEEQSIRDFARAFDYKPGLFVDYVTPTFARREVAHG